MATNVTWTMKLYDAGGNQITAYDMNTSPTLSNEIKHATGRQLNFALNGVDQLNFTLYLDDPMALMVKRLTTVVKVWRFVRNDAGQTIFFDPDSTPCFTGVVASTTKNGADNTMAVTAYSAFWKLQSRFHLLNHYLKTNPNTGSAYTQSQLIWKLIELVNEAFGYGVNSESFTGIALGGFYAANDTTISPYFVPKGSNTWTNIFDDILSRSGSVDIIPQYYHSDGSPIMVFLNTDDKRGSDISDVVSLNFHTGSNDNLNGLTEDENVVPGEFANYMWAVGAGGPNSGKVTMRENIDDDELGYNNIGIYMARKDFPDIKLIGNFNPPTHLQQVVESEFKQARQPQTSYTVDVSPAAQVWYAGTFKIGDVVKLNANKGALVVSNKKQRVFSASLNQSDNNMEQLSVVVADDFYGKVAP